MAKRIDGELFEKEFPTIIVKDRERGEEQSTKTT